MKYNNLKSDLIIEELLIDCIRHIVINQMEAENPIIQCQIK